MIKKTIKIKDDCELPTACLLIFLDLGQVVVQVIVH